MPMKILAEIHCHPSLNLNGRTVYRTAVRGVIQRGSDLLMIYSSRVGDYKFPGGGVGQEESHSQALIREVQEECGLSVVHVGAEIGAVIEYDRPLEKEYAVFKMTSHYYRCDVQGAFGAQKLDDYERDLGFQPVWIAIEDAIRFNRALLSSVKAPRWLRREIFMLDYLHQTSPLAPDT